MGSPQWWEPWLVLTTLVFVTGILAVVISVADPVLIDALAVGASELMASAGVIGWKRATLECWKGAVIGGEGCLRSAPRHSSV